MVNITNFTGFPSPYEPTGLLTLIIGVVLVVAAFYIFYKVIKNIIANSIIGGIGLVVLHFIGPVVGIEIPLNILSIVIALIGGLPGLMILILMSIFGL